jgi:histidyl-tRNA synthetase
MEVTKMSRIKPRTLSGFMELLPEEQVYFEKMAEKLRQVYSLYGFTPLDTPLIEASEILLAKGGGETEKQIYRFTKGEHDLSLRFDLTVPLAKYVALNYGKLTFPFRRFQIGKVYRGERAQRGRFREFYQADIDVIGDGSLDIINEAEIPGIIYRAFTELGLRRFVIRINNRKVLNGLFEILGVGDRAGDIMRTIDKLEKIGRDKVFEILTGDYSMEKDSADRLLNLLSCDTGPIAALSEYKGQNETFDQGVNELETVAKYMSSFGVPEENYKIDLTIARGLDYYTGTVYETMLLDHPEIGSICSGGRYDNLAEYYTDKKLPGVGISIGLTRLFFVLQDQNYLNPELPSAPADAVIIPMTDDLAPAISFATQLRELGVKTQIYSENKKFKQKMAYADKIGAQYVVLIGEDEIKEGKVTAKDMFSGSQVSASPAMIAAGIADAVKKKSDIAPIKEPAE